MVTCMVPYKYFDSLPQTGFHFFDQGLVLLSDVQLQSFEENLKFFERRADSSFHGFQLYYLYGGADEQLDKVLKTDRFRADKGFAGATERGGPRDRPVEFEKDAEEADPFGLDQFLTEVKKGKKAMDKIGGGGTMKASAGSAMKESYEGGSSRTRVDFERGR